MLDISTNNTIKELINGCLKNNRQSQNFLFEKYYSEVYKVCIRYSKDEDDAKDNLQDSFLKIFEKIESYNGKGSFDNWIRKIARNVSIDKFRSKKVPEHFKDETFDLDEIAVENDFEIDSKIQIPHSFVLNSIQELSPQYRIVFNMFAIDDMSHKEIAEKLNIGYSTSKAIYSKARKNLKNKLKKYIAENLPKE